MMTLLKVTAALLCVGIIIVVYLQLSSSSEKMSTVPLEGIYAVRTQTQISYFVLPRSPFESAECYLITHVIGVDDGAPVTISMHNLVNMTLDGKIPVRFGFGNVTLGSISYTKIIPTEVSGIYKTKNQSQPFLVVMPDEPTSKGFTWYDILPSSGDGVTLAFKHSATKARVGWNFNWSANNVRVGALGPGTMNIGDRDQPGRLVQLDKIA